MAKSSCISANTILGIVIACINIVPQIMPFDIGIVTCILISLFDIIAIFLAFALDLNYAKINRFDVKDVISFVVVPLVVPTIIAAVIYAIYVI